MKSAFKVSLALAALTIIGCKDGNKSNNTNSSSGKSSKETTYTFKFSDKIPIKNYSLAINGNFSKECEEDEEIKWQAGSQYNKFSFNENGNNGCNINITSIEFSNQDNKNEVYKLEKGFNLDTDSKSKDIYFLKDENHNKKYKISSEIISGKNREFRIDVYNPQENVVVNDVFKSRENTIYFGDNKVKKIDNKGFSFNAINRLKISTSDLVQIISYKGELEFNIENNYLIKSYSIFDSSSNINNGLNKIVNSSNIKIAANDLQFLGNLPLSYNKNEDPSKILTDHLKLLTIVLYVDNKEGIEIPTEFHLTY
ncbi:hypothetical protein ACWNT8_09785 [Pigmentibacter ruber]